MEAVCEELGIPKNHIQNCLDNKNRFLLITSKEWLKCLEQHKKICNFQVHNGLDKRHHLPSNLGHNWIKCYMHIYKKQNNIKVIPLPKCRGELFTNNQTKKFPLILSQILSFISTTNYKNLWENAYKKYDNSQRNFPTTTTTLKYNNNEFINNERGRKIYINGEYDLDLIPYDQVLRELIQRIYGCCIIHSKLDRLKLNIETMKTTTTTSASSSSSSTFSSKISVGLQNDCHKNLLPACISIETSTHFVIIFYPTKCETTLNDCITYSPAILNKSNNKPLFIIYQLLQLVKHFHDIGLIIGDIRLQDIYINENLWLQIIPNLESNIIQLEKNKISTTTTSSSSNTTQSKLTSNDDTESINDTEKFDLKFAYDLQQFTLREYTEMWCTGQLSNYDYLTILNNASGRRLNCPSYHHIMPWVTDFQQRNGEKWRDLTKSKYRLNKGDPHLDLMFTAATTETGTTILQTHNTVIGSGIGGCGTSTNYIPHHVSEFLSEITYYVYMARRTPKTILCQYVRPIWVPAEYPISIQRLQEWTPDECIPQFYSDPMVFKSIHEDLSDLELPKWSTCPEDFIMKHREALESQHVSERLHHWIDLNFGYKLTGKAAIKSKNVCLSLVDNHTNLSQRGIVQLFTHPHPPKRFPSVWFAKNPPRLSSLTSLSLSSGINEQQKRRMVRSSEDLTSHSSIRNDFIDVQSSRSNSPRKSISSSIATTIKVPSSSSHPQHYQIITNTSNTAHIPESIVAAGTTTIGIAGGGGGGCNSSGNIERSTSYHTSVHRSSNNNLIYLPKDFNPIAQLVNLENMETFFAKTFPNQKFCDNENDEYHKNRKRSEKFDNNDLMFEDSTDNSYTNYIFSHVYENELKINEQMRHNLNDKLKLHKNYIIKNPKKSTTIQNLNKIMKNKRTIELQMIGCLICELFLLHRLRPMLMNGYNCKFDERLKCCQIVIKNYINEIPKCIQNSIKLFLNIDNDNNNEDNTLKFGIIKPKSNQILQLIFMTNTILPFPKNYERIYSLITSLYNFEYIENLLKIYTYFNCDGKKCSKYDDLDRKRILFNRKISECKIKSTCLYIDGLLEPIGYEQFKPVELLLPHVIDLLKNEETSILSAWLLFDPIAIALGIKDSQKYLLEPILRLYDADLSTITSSSSLISTSIITNQNIKTIKNNNESIMKFTISSSFKSRKSVKLYHHSFLLRLIVRFGLKCFLDNFISPLIEAVGGYKEPEDSNGFHYHSNNINDNDLLQSKRTRSTKNLKFCCNEESDNSLTLISQDYYSDITQSQSDQTLSLQNSAKTEIEGIFTFENENDLLDDITTTLPIDNNDKICESEIKSLDSFETRISNLSAEEATEDLLSSSSSYHHRPQKLAIDDIINPSGNSNQSFDSNFCGSSIGIKSSSNTSSFDDDKNSLNSQKDSPKKLNDNEPIKSPTIPIPNTFRRNYELSTIDCEIGSKKSIDSIDMLTTSNKNDNNNKNNGNNTNKSNMKKSSSSRSIYDEPSDSLQASVISKMSQTKAFYNNNRISEMSTESLIWLSHRLGPVLTARYLSRNLLKMLTLCYVGQENLLPDDFGGSNNGPENINGNLNYFTVADSTVVGDRNASRVLECLNSIAALFGEQFILLQYLPHVSELIALCKKRITPSLEGALISSLQMLKYLVPCLLDSTIMEQLQDVILSTIIHPIIHILGSTKCTMPSGFLARSVLARKLLDTIYIISVRIGPEMSKEYLCIPAIQRFFLIFDKAYGITDNFILNKNSSSSLLNQQQQQQQQYQQQQQQKLQNQKGSISPPINLEELPENCNEIHLRERAYEEIRDVFTPNLAHSSYIIFLKYLGETIMSRTVINLELILTLCNEYEQPNYSSNLNNEKFHNFSFINRRLSNQDDENDSNSFGTSVIGNRIEVTTKTKQIKHEIGPIEVLDMIAYKFDQVNTSRHLRGNWLAYWEHEIGRSDKDNHLNIKQIKLQTFNGHTNTVRSILSLDNENSFMSASKDKTVKLWSLRSEGDGKKITSCQFTYTSHKKSVHSLAFLESLRYVVSCDSGVHLWDPFIGRPIGILDSQTKYSPVSIVRTYPSPSPLILCGTSESTVKIIDARIANYVNEWKVTSTQSSIVRCLACAPSGNWLAVGLSSGSIIILDGRTGMILGTFKATDGELLQLVAANEQQLISSSLDHSISVWSVHDNSLQYQLRQASEPAHCLFPNGNELIFATPANRIGIYSNLSSTDGQYSITKLRSDTLKGVLTSLAVLPLNRMILTGNDSGNIVLLC